MLPLPLGEGWGEGLSTAKADQDGFHHLATNGFKGSWPQTGNQMPSVVFQQLLAEFLVAGQKEPVLRQDDGDGAAGCTLTPGPSPGGRGGRGQFQAAVEEHGRQIVLRG